MERRIALCAGLAGLILAPAGCSPARPASAKDFLTAVIADDISAVRIGTLVHDNAARTDVRDFAGKLAEDHRASEDKAEALATELGIAIPTESDQKGQAEYTKLLGLSGADFDNEFVRYIIADHRADIASFNAAAHSSDARIAAFAGSTVPSLEQHLKAAQALAAKTKSTGKNSS